MLNEKEKAEIKSRIETLFNLINNDYCFTCKKEDYKNTDNISRYIIRLHELGHYSDYLYKKMVKAIDIYKSLDNSDNSYTYSELDAWIKQVFIDYKEEEEDIIIH